MTWSGAGYWNVPEDSVQEFLGCREPFFAEDGASATAVVNAATKAGGQLARLHLCYERDKSLQAASPNPLQSHGGLTEPVNQSPNFGANSTGHLAVASSVQHGGLAPSSIATSLAAQ